jgi:hypothetical protein
MSIEAEFETVSLMLQSEAETRAVDAFVLSLIKAERQVRKLFTHLVYQFPVFRQEDKPALRSTLAERRDVYFEGVVAGLDALYPKPVRELVGSEYGRLESSIDEATRHRNKIFHGQLTGSSLSRDELLRLVKDIRTWCTCLGENAAAEIGYDGFDRNSLKKSRIPNLWMRYKNSFLSIGDYERFINAHMARRPPARRRHSS